jgi:hypothetical protein
MKNEDFSTNSGLAGLSVRDSGFPEMTLYAFVALESHPPHQVWTVMSNEQESSRQSSPPPPHDYDKFNFLPHVLNLLNLIHSDADTGTVSTEVRLNRM